MTLNIIKVTTQRAENNQKIIKDNFYIISIEIVFILSWNFYVPGSFPTISQVLIIKISIT